jgi:hypothetical protein
MILVVAVMTAAHFDGFLDSLLLQLSLVMLLRVSWA